MILKGLVDEDVVNYKKISMFVIFPYCSFKCDKENGNQICQNCHLTKEPVIEISIDQLCERYLSNPLTEAIVCGGLEPFDTSLDLFNLISTLRDKYNCKDDIVIYTGYTKEELEKGIRINPNGEKEILDFDIDFWYNLKRYKNIIIKYGRFILGDEPHYDPVLGVNLASNNQYGEKIS